MLAGAWVDRWRTRTAMAPAGLGRALVLGGTAGAVLVAAAAVGDGVFLLVPALHGPPAVTLPALVAINAISGTFGQLVNVT